MTALLLHRITHKFNITWMFKTLVRVEHTLAKKNKIMQKHEFTRKLSTRCFIIKNCLKFNVKILILKS